MSDALRLFGTRALVTSASDGIGEAIVRIFSKQGAEVVAVDGQDSSVMTQFQGVRNVVPMVDSLSDPESVKALVKQARDEFGGIDVVVNNAYLQPKVPVSDADTAALDALLERKIRSYSMVARTALPYLETSPAGRIVNIGCLRSAFTVDGTRAFRRSEQALAELTATLAEDAGPMGTNVSYVQPGAVMTAASRRIFKADKALRDYCIRRSAAGRVGEPVDIAKVVLFLSSDDSVFVTGTGIVADGGTKTAP